MPLLFSKIKENTFVMLPVVLIVSFLHFTFVPLGTIIYLRFLIASLLIIIGLSLFLVGVDLSITPLGGHTGLALIKSKRLWIVIGAGLVLGFIISIAEPGLIVYAGQVNVATQGQIASMQLILWVSIGLAFMIGLGFLRIIYSLSFRLLIAILYGAVFIMATFASPEYLAIAFDAAGATTGIVAVPFILALSMGLSRLKKNQIASENDAFGLVSIASVGAIMAVLLLGYVQRNFQFADSIEWGIDTTPQLLRPFVILIQPVLIDSFLALLPLLLIFLLLQWRVLALNKKAFSRIIKGFIYTFIGLWIFLIGANGGFMNVGALLGVQLIAQNSAVPVVIIAFFIGLLTIIAEPAVSVLTHQIEDVTTGYIRRPIILGAMGIGVGIAISLSILRIVIPSFQLWHILLPGYALALGLMVFTPRLFIGIAFDAGVVATGPLTATFTLAFVQGVANAHPIASVVVDGFGMIALVALAPIITLQVVGIFYQVLSKKRGVKHG